jgi:hypothetical protein
MVDQILESATRLPPLARFAVALIVFLFVTSVLGPVLTEIIGKRMAAASEHPETHQGGNLPNERG